MKKIVVTKRQGVTQHAWLLGTMYADEWDIENCNCSAYMSGLDYQWFDYQHLQDIVAYWFWYENLTGIDELVLCNIAYDHNQDGHNLFKGWAALKLLTEDMSQLSSDLLSLAIIAAERHIDTMVGRNALTMLECESDNREFGY